MAIGFETREDLCMRLDKTICFYKGRPVIIQAKRGDFLDANTVMWRRLGGRKWGECQVDDEDFSYRAPRLGYVNFKRLNVTSAVWLARKPYRQQKCGLPLEYINYILVDTHSIRRADSTLTDTSAMASALMNDYSPVEEAVKNILDPGGDFRSVAIHREFALHRPELEEEELVISYCGRTVGKFDAESHRVDLYPRADASFVERSLGDLNLGVRCYVNN